MKQLSGVELLRKLTPQMLREYDFVTCPNDAVRESLEKKIDDAGRTSEPTELCYGSMVLLVRRHAVQAYLRRYGSLPSWGEVGPDFVGGNSGNPIKIEFSDPRQAGGGELFLAMLREAQTGLRLKGERGKAEWLWGEDGPRYSYGAKSTKQLLRTFLNGGPQQMVFVYEHDVIAALLKEPERAKNFSSFCGPRSKRSSPSTCSLSAWPEQSFARR